MQLKARVERLENELRKATNRPPPSAELAYLQDLVTKMRQLLAGAGEIAET